MTNIDTPMAAQPRGIRPKPTATAFSAPAAPSKSDTVIKLLLRTKGATTVELITATDWQPHSVRAFLSGLRKKGRAIVREPRKSGDAAYRIVVAVAANAQPTTDPSTAIEPDTTSLTSAAGADA
jgi:hypothetical protein